MRVVSNIRLPLLVGCTALLALALPVLWSCALDWDTGHYIARLERDPGAAVDLYTLGGRGDETRRWIADGMVEWYTDPAAYVAFLRPAGSVLFAGMVAGFGWTATPYYVVTVLVFCGLIAAVAALFRSTLPLAVGALAVLIFAVDDMHSESVFWIANQHAVVAEALGVLGVVFHVRWRQGKPTALWASIGCWAVAAVTSEHWLGSLAFVVALEAVGYPSPRRRIQAVIPAVAMAVAYVVFYQVAGFGPVGRGGYANPLSDPGQVLATLGHNLEMALRESMFGAGTLGLAGAAAMFALAVPFVVAGVRSAAPPERRAMAGIGIGSVLSLAPFLGMSFGDDAWMNNRALISLSIGIAAFWAVALVQALAWARSRLPAPARAAAAIVAIAIAALAFVLSPWQLRVELTQVRGYLDAAHDGGLSVMRQALAHCGERRPVWIRAPANVYALLGSVAEASRGNAATASPALYLVDAEPDHLVLTRTGERRFELDAGAETPLANADGGTPAQPIRVPGGTIRVLSAPGRPLSRIEVALDEPADRVCFVSLTAGGDVTPLSLPPPGERTEL